MNARPHRRSHAPGVTCALCCHNSRARLEPTLRHLAAQRVPDGLSWEVVVVDNASTDGTGQAAPDFWSGPPERLRVVAEPTPGLSHARMRALAETRHDVLSFIDDDNHVAPDWVATVAGVMGGDPSLGVLGGRIFALPESQPPEWFDEVKRFWAVHGDPPRPAGGITGRDNLPSGAGMTLRTRALNELIDAGFRFTLTGRAGGGLAAGEDHEMVMALLLRGWTARHEPALELRHFIPNGRLTWEYAVGLLRGVGEAWAMMDAYLMLWMERNGQPVGALQRHWLWRAAEAARLWLRLRAKAAASTGADRQAKILLAERARGRCLAILRMRAAYMARQREVAQAPWLRNEREETP